MSFLIIIIDNEINNQMQDNVALEISSWHYVIICNLIRNAAKPGHVYMDAMGFGMGLSCLQITFQACCLQEAETLYDQLAPLCPIMLALTAATPFARGYLTEVDCRCDRIPNQ